MFFIILPFTFVYTPGSTHSFAYAIPLVIDELTHLLVAVGPQHLTILAVSLPILPKPFLLAAIAPLHDTFTVHDVSCECTDVFRLGLAPAVDPVTAFYAVHEFTFLYISVDPCFDPFSMFFVFFEVAFVCVAICVN